MEIIQVKSPTTHTWCDEDATLHDDGEWSSLQTAKNAGVDLVIYWYKTGSYEGDGQALLRKGDKWDLEGLGHCSCYGPLDEYSWPDSGGQTLAELKARCSEDLLKEVALLFEEAEKLNG